MRITGIASTGLFTGTAARPLQVVRVTVARDPGSFPPSPADVLVSLHGPQVSTPEPARLAGLAAGEARIAEVSILAAAPAGPGSIRQVTAIAQATTEQPGRTPLRSTARGQITLAEPGWTMWMVSHFHYDPVWWNTQGQFTQSWPVLAREDGTLPDVRPAFELVRLHLDEARTDPDYKFVLAEIDYLKPYFDAFPQDRADLLTLIAAGRIEIVGGSYNEPNTNLTSAESTIRNAIYGLGFQREVLGATPSTAWMLDAFGFDPAYPGLMAAAGLTESAWARGPFHQWGPARTVGDNRRMQFPAEFEWLSPDGRGLLTGYLPNHYGAGWVTAQAPDLAAAEQAACEQFEQLAAVAATPNVLLPVGGDHVIPSRWATAIYRDWKARYVWPRFVTAVPGEYFAAVRESAAERGIWLMPQTRDMNPVYPGKDVSYIDTKQAQREAEVAVGDAERLSALAWITGADYPAASLDRAWRLLAFGAHHDAITGTESDQVYLDLLAGWREARDRGARARDSALRRLAALADTAALARPAALGEQAAGSAPAGKPAVSHTDSAGSPASRAAADGPSARPPGRSGQRAILVANTLAWTRDGLAATTIRFARPGTAGIALTDQDGAPVRYLAQGITRHPDGSLAEATLTFPARSVPGLGYATYLAAPMADGALPEAAPGAAPGPRRDTAPRGGLAAEHDPGQAGWTDRPGLTIENETFAVTADPGQGGALRSIVDRRTGTELLAGRGNELLLQPEYPTHPRWGEGPWLLCPAGPARGGAAARVRAQRCPVGSRLIAEFDLDDLRVTAETLLWDGAQRIEFRTHVDGSIGQDNLLRARFATAVTGGLPVFQTGLSVIGRSPGHAEMDVAEHPDTLDNPAHEWFAVGSTARVAVTVAGGRRTRHAIGVAEVIAPAGSASDAFAPRDPGAGGGARKAVRDLLIALAAQGVTATCTVPAGPRCGWAELDSGLPDVRIAVGGPAENAFTAEVLARSGLRARFDAALAAAGRVIAWVPPARDRASALGPGADLRGSIDLPVLVIAGPDLGAEVSALARDLADGDIEATGLSQSADPTGPDLADHTVALLNRGIPGSLVTPAGEAYIALMRACSTWPSGVWLDGDRRTVPDGSSFGWQHWSHTFEYALAAGPGDWRAAGFPAAGQDYRHPLLSVQADPSAGPLPARCALAEVRQAGSAGQVTGGRENGPADPGTDTGDSRVDLMVIKPRGNPLTPTGQPDRDAGLTVRMRDLSGRPGASTVSLRLVTGIAAARISSVTEDATGAPARIRDGQAQVVVPASGILTLAVTPAAPVADLPATRPAGYPHSSAAHPHSTTAHPHSAARTAAGAAPDPGQEDLAGTEPAPPAFARYWLHGTGPAPAGNMPLAVHLGPALAQVPPGGQARLRLTAATGPGAADGDVLLDIPHGLRVAAIAPAGSSPGSTAGPARGTRVGYALAPMGFAAWEITLAASADARPGRYFVTAQSAGPGGGLVADATAIGVGESPGPAERTSPEAPEHLMAAVLAEAAEADLTLATGDLCLAPGSSGEVVAILANRSRSSIRGSALLISPTGSWTAASSWTTRFDIDAGSQARLRFGLTIPADSRPGQRWWALIKAMYFGRVRYSPATWVEVNSRHQRPHRPDY